MTDMNITSGISSCIPVSYTHLNRALALQKERYEHGEKKLGYARLCKLLTEWRNSTETTWLADVPVHPLQQKLKDLEWAYAHFFA